MTDIIFLCTDAAGLHSELQKRINEKFAHLRYNMPRGTRFKVDAVSLVGDAKLLVVIVAIRVYIPASVRIARALRKKLVSFYSSIVKLKKF